MGYFSTSLRAGFAVIIPVVCMLGYSAAHAQNNEQVLLDNEFIRAVKTVREAGVQVEEDSIQGAVLVFLSGSLVETGSAGNQVSELRATPGDVHWSPPGRTAFRVVGPGSVTLVRIELKNAPIGTPWATPLDPLTVDSRQYSLVLENKHVRIMRVKVGPHEVVGPHEHPLRRAVVYLTDMNARIMMADGTENAISRKAGQVSWNPPARHTEENLDNAGMDLVVIEIR